MSDTEQDLMMWTSHPEQDLIAQNTLGVPTLVRTHAGLLITGLLDAEVVQRVRTSPRHPKAPLGRPDAFLFQGGDKAL